MPSPLREALSAPFDSARWRELLAEIFPGAVQFDRHPVSHPVPTDRIRGCREFGRVLLADGRGLVLLEIEIGDTIDLLRNRVELRNLVARFIDQDRAHGVLAVIRSGSSEYRLTFASRVSEFDAAAETFVQRETATRRFTYVLGHGHECHTASHRLSALAAKGATATLDDVVAAFNVEPVSNEFFARYKEHYTAFCAHLLASDAPARVFRIALDGLDDKARDRALKPVRDFVKKLLGRIVFLHFLQKKGWLGCPAARTDWREGDPRFLLSLFESCADRSRFHSRCLAPLFFDTLNNPHRPGHLFAVTGSRIPYLNGGLFERDFDGVERVDFPAPLFAGLLEFFGQYHFTIDENDPDDHEIGIDPEMLSHIFENLLEDNKDKGAYYTPKAVVQYMCQQSLIHALCSHFPGDAEAKVEIEKLIRHKEPIDARDTKSWLARHATQIEQILDALKICDPAIGSGAFPIGLLQEIFWTKMTLHPGANRAVVKRAIIQNSIHGVDLDGGAVEIARLRFWLALIVDEDEPLPLPNLDYQIMQGNSLLESFEGIDLSRLSEPARVGIQLIGSAQAEFGLAAEQAEMTVGTAPQSDLADLQQAYFDCHDPEEKARLRARIDAAVLHAIDFEIERRREMLAAALENWTREIARKKRANKGRYDPTAAEEKKRATWQAELAALTAKSERLHQLLAAPRAERPFFLWHLWFREIFADGGFDIVIGNPPYVRADNQDFLPQRAAILAEKRGSESSYVTLWEKWDLYVPFIELGHTLLRPGGIETMIVSDAYCHSKYAIKSQDWFLQNAIIRRLDFLGKLQIFDAGVKNMIFFYARGDGSQNVPERHVHAGRFGNVSVLPSAEQAAATHRLFFPETDSEEFGNFTVETVPIEQVCYISVGMVAHAHEKIARGEFELRDLVSAVRDKTHPKPFVEAKHLERWRAATHRWLEWGTRRSPAMLRRQTFPELYEAKEKLTSVDMAAGVDSLTVIYDDAQLFHNHSAWSFVPWHYLKGVRNRSLKKSARYSDESKPGDDLPDRRKLEALSRGFDAKYLVAVMNSKVARRYLMKHRRSNIHLFPDDWKSLPIPVISPAEQATLSALVDRILAAKRAGDAATVAALEVESDTHVFRLYGLTPEEVALIQGNAA